MTTRLVIDEELLTDALKEGGLRTKRDTVHAAMREYIQKRRQKNIRGLFGTIDFDPAYDHKQGRGRV